MLPPSDCPTLLLVDDEATNLHVLKQILQDSYRLLFAKDGTRAIQLAAQEAPDLILLDVMLPGLDGFEVCRRLKQEAASREIPVIFVTALDGENDESRGFEAGCVDYISKPLSPAVVRARVRTHLSLVRVEELLESRLQVVQRLGMAAEYKDNETGQHVIRMSHFSRILAEAAGFPPSAAEEMLHAAPMHDIGKIGIPDAILTKTGRLSPEEWEVMRRHPEIGARIIGEHADGLLRRARLIALHHHERWDGGGYPLGLAGSQIPMEARIVAIADVFDALISTRPYKPAWPVDEALALIREQRGKHFDPELVDLFLERLPDILQVLERWRDPVITPSSILEGQV